MFETTFALQTIGITRSRLMSLDVAPLQGIHRPAHRAEHDLALLLQARLEHVEARLELDAGHHPKRPVT